MSNQNRKPLMGVLSGLSLLLFLPMPMQGQVDTAVPTIEKSKPVSQIRASTTVAAKPALVPVNLSKLTDRTSEREGWALAFNGRGDHITAPYIPFDEYKVLTVEAWVRGWRLAILCQGRAGDPENSIWLSLGMNATQPHETCGWEYGTGKNHQVAVGKANRIEWNHVALVYDGTRQYVYLNGKLTRSIPATKPGPFNKSRKLIIGAHQYNTLSYGSGLLGSVRISKVARYRANFTPSRKLSADADTVLLYDLAQGKGTRLRDASGNKRDGTITGARWLKANEIFSLDLSGTQVTDAGLKHLKGLAKLEMLRLNGTRITDAGLQHLKELTNLEVLYLGGTQITDAGVIHLKKLQQLMTLGLSGTTITDNGLQHMKALVNLEELYLGNTRITNAGLESLSDLKGLKNLYLRGRTRVTAAGVLSIKKAVPKINVTTSRSVVTAPRSVVTTPQSVDELLKQIDTIRENVARSKGRKKPAGPAKTERTLHVLFKTPHLKTYYVNSSGGTRYARFLASELVFVNNTKQSITIKRDQILLKSDDQTLKLQDIPSQAGNQYFQIKRKSYPLRTLKLLKTLTVPSGKNASSWVAFTGIPQGSAVPRLVLEMNINGKRTEWNINDYALGVLNLKIERIGPRGSLGLLTINGRLNTVNLGSVISALDRWAAQNVVRAVIRWTDSAEEVDAQLLSWLKQGAALAGSGNSINNPQMPMIAPASMHELHLAHIPKYNSSRGRSTTTSVYTPYGRPISINLESRVHKTDIDAVSAALVSAYRNLPAEEVIREIETGHPLTRVAAIAGGGARLPEENLPVLLNYADHKYPRYQKAALVALGHFGQKEAIEKLISFTRLNDNDLARVATESLAASRYSAAHRALLDVLKSEKSPSKKVIITALARFPRSLWSETIYEVAAEFNPETSVEALRALARIGHPKLTNLYEKALQQSNTKLRDEAFKLLLTRTDPESERMALEFTLNHLKKSPPTPEMYKLLTRTKDPRAVPMLLKHFRESKGSNSTVTNLLAQIGDQTVADVFVEMYPQLKQTSSKTTVLKALQQLRSPAFRKLAGEALYEKNSSLVSTACRYLQGDGSPEANRMLIEAFEKSNHSSTLSYIGNALGTIGTSEARAVLVKARDSKNTQKKNVAVSAIRNLQRRSPGYSYLYQGNNFRKQKQKDNAINYYTRAIQMDPQLSEAYSGRALVLITQTGKGKEARADFVKAEKLDPYNVQAVAYSTLLMANAGNYTAALKKSEQVRKRFLKDNSFAFQTARLYGKAAKWAITDKKLSEVDRKKMAETYRKKSMQELQRAFKLGFKSTGWASTTPDLEPIRNLPEFKKLVGPDKTKSKQKSNKKSKQKSTQKRAAPAPVPVPGAQKSR